MSEKIYMFALRQSFASKLGMYAWLNNGKEEVIVCTLREFVDRRIEKCLSEPTFFIRVNRREFFEDNRDNYLEPKFLKLLGWQYPEACRLIEKEGAIFILTIYPKYESRLYSFWRARDDDEYGYQIIVDCFEKRGGEIIRIEYDPSIHGPDYVMEDPRMKKKEPATGSIASPPIPPVLPEK